MSSFLNRRKTWLNRDGTDKCNTMYYIGNMPAKPKQDLIWSVPVTAVKKKGEFIMKKTKFVRPKPIPPFKTLDEEAEFWDTHDTSLLFKNPNIKLSDLPLIEDEKEEVLTVRLQKSVKKKLEKVARAKGINPSTLSRMWLIEKLSRL